MELNEFIKSFSSGQKYVFTTFVMQTPLAFTLMNIYIPSFRENDLFIQIVYSISASIVYLAIVYAPIYLYYALFKIKIGIEIQLLSAPAIFTTFFLLKDPTKYELGYSHLMNYVSYSFMFTIISVLLLFLISCIIAYCKKRNGIHKDAKYPNKIKQVHR